MPISFPPDPTYVAKCDRFVVRGRLAILPREQAKRPMQKLVVLITRAIELSHSTPKAFEVHRLPFLRSSSIAEFPKCIHVLKSAAFLVESVEPAQKLLP